MSSTHDQGARAEAAAGGSRQYVPRPADGGYETQYVPVGSSDAGGGSAATMGFTTLGYV
ncbi:MAG TPA: hypothetical protein VN969_34350 [Streptosporangiaceae bacterium]|jgi:hypothetical protein|nr:hypothetical protein [Streptosporangiaceae bacterium]